jgi:hypothetical protein
MKSIYAALIVVLVSLSTATLAQTAAPASEAQSSFNRLKSLSGTWDGKVTTTPPAPEIDGTTMHVTLRTTSMGNAVIHEMTSPARKDDPITMFYLENDKLMLTHYCDAGNRPRMTAKSSPDGKNLDFDFVDVIGNMQYGHMHHANFTIIDDNHHIEEWTYMAGDKPIRAHIDLQRTK